MNDFFKQYGGHLAAYLTSALGIIAFADPSVFGPKGPLIVALAGALAGAASNVHVATSPPVAASSVTISSVVKSHIFATILAGLIVVAALTGCKTAPTPTEQSGIAVAFTLATGAAIQEKNTPAGYLARATSFKAIAVEIKTANDAGTTTLATVATDLAPLIAKLPAADQLAAHDLVAALAPFISQEVTANPQLQNAQATLDDVLQAVITTCATYGA